MTIRILRDERVRRFLPLLLLLLATIPLLTKIFTSDFGTHLAMGRQIVQTGSIPDREFLNYPSLGRRNPNGEWGFQALLYLVYSAAGPLGVSFLCWLVVFGIFLLLHRAMILRGANPYLAVVAIFAFSGFLRIRIQPRPELFTYLFIALTIFLFSEYYFGRRKRLVYLFPPMVLVWANMHPSYLMAFLLCGVFFADAIVRAAWGKRMQWEAVKEWIFPPVIAGGAGLLLCGLNPLGYEAILTPLQLISRGKGAGGDSVLMSISELTPVKGTGMYWYYQAAAVFTGVSLLMGAVGRRIYLIDLLLFSIAFKGAWDSARAVSMMGLFLSPGASLHLTGFFAWMKERFVSAPEAPSKPEPAPSRKRKRKKGKGAPSPGFAGVEPVPPRKSFLRIAVSGVILCALLVFGGVTLSFSFSQIQFGVGMTEHKFSFAAAEFLRKNPVPGKMFNFFDVGGFLDWQLYPQALTFLDGRTYNPRVFMEHQAVTGAMGNWKEIIQRYGITYAVLKSMDSSGMVLPVIAAMTNDPEWELVFADGLFVVFVRNTPETREYIAKHRLPKSRVPQQIIWESYHYIFLGISPVLAYQTMSNMYELMGNRQAAIESLRKALDHADEPFLRSRLLRLQGGGRPHRGPGR